MTHRLNSFAKLMSSVALVSGIVMSGSVAAQAGGPAIVCADYVQGKTSLPGQRIGKKIQKAYEAYSNDQLEEAIAILKDIDTKQAFDRAYTDRFIGNLLASKDDGAPEAIQYLTRAVNAKVLNDPDQVSSLRLLADLNLMEKKFDDAIKYYKEWMNLTCKEDPDVYLRIAQAYHQTQQYDKIIAPADKAIALYPKPSKNPYLLKVASYYERKMYQPLIKVAEELVRVFPDQAQWWVQLGQFYFLVEDYDKALSTFDMAYQQGYLTKGTEMKYLVQLFSTKGIPYKAAVLLEKHLKSGLIETDESIVSTLANTWQQARHYDKAAEYFGKAAKLSDDPKKLLQKQGMALYTAERYDEAIAALEEALKHNPSETDVGKIQLALMEANFYQGKYKQALVHVKAAAKIKNSRRNATSWERYIRDKAKNNGVKL